MNQPTWSSALDTTGSRTFCGRCGHGMHWHECGAAPLATLGTVAVACRCRNDEPETFTPDDRSHLELAVPEPDPSPPKPRWSGCSVFGWLALAVVVLALSGAQLGSLAGVLGATGGVDRGGLGPRPLSLRGLLPLSGIPDQGFVRCSRHTPAVASQGPDECRLIGGSVLGSFAAPAFVAGLEPVAAPGSKHSVLIDRHDRAPSVGYQHNHVTTPVNTPVLPPVYSAADVTYSGIVNYADPRHGRFYLAIPDGKGVRVEICGPAGCLIRTSTDAGPALHMQRAGRIADLNSVDWQEISGVPLRFGGFQGTILILKRPPRIALPATDLEDGT